MVPNYFFYPQVSVENIITKYDSWRSSGQFLSLGQKFRRYFFQFFVFQTSRDRFAVKMVKEWNFVHLVDVLVNKRFKKHYHFSLHCCERIATT